MSPAARGRAGKCIPLDARFYVISTSSGEVKGTVQVTCYDEDSQIACMRCVEPKIAAFWEHLAGRAGYDESPPRSVQLERYPLPEDINPIEEDVDPVDVAGYGGGPK